MRRVLVLSAVLVVLGAVVIPARADVSSPGPRTRSISVELADGHSRTVRAEGTAESLCLSILAKDTGVVDEGCGTPQLDDHDPDVLHVIGRFESSNAAGRVLEIDVSIARDLARSRMVWTTEACVPSIEPGDGSAGYDLGCRGPIMMNEGTAVGSVRSSRTDSNAPAKDLGELTGTGTWETAVLGGVVEGRVPPSS